MVEEDEKTKKLSNSKEEKKITPKEVAAVMKALAVSNEPDPKIELKIATPNAYRRSFSGKNILIGIAGIIGAGKTTLTKKFAEYTGFKTCFEPTDDNPMLSMFYKDQARWGFTFQADLLGRRFALHQKTVWSGANYIQDRTLYEDPIFAKMLFEAGTMTEPEFNIYRNLFNSMQNFLHRPNLIIYLDVTPETAMARISQRGRECEKGLPIEYQRDLKRCYEEWLLDIKNRIPVIRVDWNEIKDVSYIVKCINKAFETERDYALLA